MSLVGTEKKKKVNAQILSTGSHLSTPRSQMSVRGRKFCVAHHETMILYTFQLPCSFDSYNLDIIVLFANKL